MPREEAGGSWSLQPPAWAPVSVPGGLTLVRRNGLFVWAGAMCAYPAGFVFHLVAGFDRRLFSYRQLGFHRRERFTDPAPAMVQVRFPDDRVANSASLPGDRPPKLPVLRPCTGTPEPGMTDDAYGWHESRWWVSPLPPPGLLHFTVYLRGSAQPTGTASIDSRAILGAARRAALP